MNREYRVESSRALADRVHEIWVHAPHVARHAKAGQFVVIRIDETGERIPLTISATDEDSVRVIFMAVGRTTHQLASLMPGDEIRDVAGPLGRPSEVRTYGTCAVVGGGVGIAGAPMIAKALKNAGNKVIGIIGARNADLLILEEDMKSACDELHVATDDGSRGVHGFVSDVLKQELGRRQIDAAWIIGPAIMMKVTSAVTRPFGIKTFVSLNPVMVDGTGMCGSCRVLVGGSTKFACVDGPEFDAAIVDFDTLMQRQRTYLEEERIALERYLKDECARHGGW